MMHKPMPKALQFICALIILFASCSLQSGGSVSLESADALIASGQGAQAVKVLKSLSREKLPDMARIGVYRRLIALGDAKAGEACLKTGLKHNAESTVLRAAYTGFLLDTGRFSEAEKISEPLSGSEYAGLRAEARLASADGQYYDADLIPFYMDAYRGSNDERWLKNAAIVQALSGDTVQREAQEPAPYAEADSALFWAYMFYDSARYSQALTAAQAAVDLGRKMGERASGREGSMTYAEEGLLLEADLYQMAGENDRAEEARASFMLLDALAPPVILYNSAHYALLKGDEASAFMFLQSLVSEHPDYAPGLALYARFALSQLYESVQGDSLDRALKDSGLSSLKMELAGESPRVSIEDAESLIDEAALVHKDPALIIQKRLLSEQFDAFLASQGMPLAASRESLWELLERNTDADGRCPPEFIQYAVWDFVKNGSADAGMQVFSRHIRQRYGREISSGLEGMEAWEYEYAAYFLLEEGRASEARILYDRLLASPADDSPDLASRAAYEPSPEMLLNMSVLYNGLGDPYQAMETCRQAAARALDADLKAESLYRLASIQSASGDRMGALASLEYCLTLNPSHNKARLLLNSIKR